jgi:hypothetical protein
MSRVDENVVEALKAAAVQIGQPVEVAQRLVAWLDALAKGNTTMDDSDESTQRISDLLDLVRTPLQNNAMDMEGDE